MYAQHFTHVHPFCYMASEISFLPGTVRKCKEWLISAIIVDTFRSHKTRAQKIAPIYSEQFTSIAYIYIL